MEQDRCAGQLIVSTLLKDLPGELDLTHYFDGHPKVDEAMRDILKSHPSCDADKHLGATLAQYGIFPAQLIDVLAAISRTIIRFQRAHHLSDTIAVRVGERTEEHPLTVDWIDILGEVINVTDLESVIAYRLLMWLYAVAAIKPLIIPGFIYKPDAPYWWAMPGGMYCNCVNSLYEPWSHLAVH